MKRASRNKTSGGDGVDGANGKIRKTISLKPAVLKNGLKRAIARNRNFSNHVETLIERDALEAGLVAAR